MEYILLSHIGAEYMPVDQQFVSLMNRTTYLKDNSSPKCHCLKHGFDLLVHCLLLSTFSLCSFFFFLLCVKRNSLPTVLCSAFDYQRRQSV